MAKWQRKLVLNPEWDLASEGEIRIQELARIVANRLRSLPAFSDESLNDERDKIAEEFEALAEDQTATTSDFDYVMQSLYEWGDTPLDNNFGGKRACWIDTISPVAA